LNAMRYRCSSGPVDGGRRSGTELKSSAGDARNRMADWTEDTVLPKPKQRSVRVQGLASGFGRVARMSAKQRVVMKGKSMIFSQENTVLYLTDPIWLTRRYPPLPRIIGNRGTFFKFLELGAQWFKRRVSVDQFSQ
jgi:hypothetical protein